MKIDTPLRCNLDEQGFTSAYREATEVRLVIMNTLYTVIVASPYA